MFAWLWHGDGRRKTAAKVQALFARSGGDDVLDKAVAVTGFLTTLGHILTSFNNHLRDSQPDVALHLHGGLFDRALKLAWLRGILES